MWTQRVGSAGALGATTYARLAHAAAAAAFGIPAQELAFGRVAVAPGAQCSDDLLLMTSIELTSPLEGTVEFYVRDPGASGWTLQASTSVRHPRRDFEHRRELRDARLAASPVPRDVRPPIAL